jgi:predicted DNA-binding transcriptional regulator AlpA
MSSKVLSSAETAALIGITPGTLKWWRHLGKGPRFVKLGNAKQAGVAYVEADVLEWRDQRMFASTSAYSPAALANTKFNRSGAVGASG